MFEGVKIYCSFADEKDYPAEGSVELCLDEDDKSVLHIETPALKVNVNIEDLKKALRQLEVV